VSLHVEQGDTIREIAQKTGLNVDLTLAGLCELRDHFKLSIIKAGQIGCNVGGMRFNARPRNDASLSGRLNAGLFVLGCSATYIGQELRIRRKRCLKAQGSPRKSKGYFGDARIAVG